MRLQVNHSDWQVDDGVPWKAWVRRCMAVYTGRVLRIRRNIAGFTVEYEPEDVGRWDERAAREGVIATLRAAQVSQARALEVFDLLEAEASMSGLRSLQFRPTTHLSLVPNWKAVVAKALADLRLEARPPVESRGTLILGINAPEDDPPDSEVEKMINLRLKHALGRHAAGGTPFVDQSVQISNSPGNINVAAGQGQATQVVIDQRVTETRNLLQKLRDTAALEADEPKDERRAAVEAIDAAQGDTTAKNVERAVALVANLTSIVDSVGPTLQQLAAKWSLVVPNLPSL